MTLSKDRINIYINMPVTIGGLEGTCNDCGKHIYGDVTFRAAEHGPVVVLATGSIVSEASEHHGDPISRVSGQEHGSFVLNRTVSGRVQTLGIITAAAGETVAVAMVIDEDTRQTLASEMMQIRGEKGI